jgi:hypothetical protein
LFRKKGRKTFQLLQTECLHSTHKLAIIVTGSYGYMHTVLKFYREIMHLFYLRLELAIEGPRTYEPLHAHGYNALKVSFNSLVAIQLKFFRISHPNYWQDSWINIMHLNPVSQRKSAIFVLSSIVAKSLAKKNFSTLLEKWRLRFSRRKYGRLTVKETKIGRFAERETPYNRSPIDD